MSVETQNTRQRLRRVLHRVFIGMTVAFLLGLAVSWHVAGSLVAPCPRAIGMPPSDLLAETVQIPNSSGSLLSGWYAAQDESKGAVLLLHGIHASRLQMLDRARMLKKEGYSVLLIDFRAHGESPGQSITVGHEERCDVTAALDFLCRMQPEQRVAVVGVSMGGAAAILAQSDAIDALVLESVYPSISEAVENRVRRRVGLLEPIATWLLLTQLRVRLGISPDDLRPIDAIQKIVCPVLVMSGAEDKHTTLAETQRMFYRAPSPKELEVFPGVGHKDLFNSNPKKYRERVLGFLEKHLETEGHGSAGLSRFQQAPDR